MNDIIIINKLICQSHSTKEFYPLLLQLATIYHRAMSIYPMYRALYKDFNAHDILEYLALQMSIGIQNGKLAIYTAMLEPEFSPMPGSTSSLPIGFITIHSTRRRNGTTSRIGASWKQRWAEWRKECHLKKKVFNSSEISAYQKAARVPQLLGATIIHFAVDSKHQNQGIGSRLVEKVVEDYESYTIQVVATSSSRNVLNKHGFSLQQVQDLHATAIYKMLRTRR